MHIGTFTPEGTYAAAAERLPLLADVGVTVIELMPVADFAGRFGWGYDGVDLWAPTHLYGRPDDLRRFVDRAHALGIGVILDVVYNHFGPDGNYLTQFSNTYFSDKYENEWGEPINFDGPGSAGVRELCVENAGYWVQEFHFDGLRLDATQQIFDASPDHLVAAIARRVRAAAGGRGCLLVAENEPQETRMVRAPEAGGYGLDALWNDDFHHAARVALTGHNEAYYSDYRGTPQEILSAVKWGYLYQGQRYAWQNERRGTPALDLPANAFVTFLENHDQVANSVRGERLTTLTSPGMLRAMTAVVLLGPATPMLFQGQEWGSTRPFVYFADHKPELAKAVDEGRRKFLSQFPSCATEAAQAQVLTPHHEATFAACKLDWAERERNTGLAGPAPGPAAAAARRPGVRAWRRGCIHGAVHRSRRAGAAVRLPDGRSPAGRQPGARPVVGLDRGAAAGSPLPAPLANACGPARTRSTAARGPGPSRATPGSTSPARRRSCWRPRRSHEQRGAGAARLARGRVRRRASGARMAADQRPRRLRIGHDRRDADAAIARSADRGAAGAPRPHVDAEPPASRRW